MFKSECASHEVSSPSATSLAAAGVGGAIVSAASRCLLSTIAAWFTSRILSNMEWASACSPSIRSGYIFEKAVSEELEQQGFSLTPVKRINHKEFDVVTIRDGIIFNIQCKNNMVDVTKLEANVRLFARYNRARSASYERALRKEVNRESLLLNELGLARVEHLVVSRFPVATDNPRVISYSQIGDIGAIAAALAHRQT